MADGNQTGELVHATSDTGLVPAGGGFMAAPRSFEDLKEMAKYMAKGELMVGASVRGNPGDCMAVIMQAGRFGMDPFALSQKTYVVTDKAGVRKIAYEAQAVTSMIFASRAIEGRLRYRYEGEGLDRRVTVMGRVKGDSEDCEITTPPLRVCKGKSPLWDSDPDQQLAYYGSRAWARRHTPDVLMGVYDVEEFESTGRYVDVTPERSQSPADRLTASINKSAEDRAQESAPEPEPEERVQDADFTDADDAAEMTMEDVEDSFREELEREPLAPERQEEEFTCASEGNAQGDLLVSQPKTDGNGAKLKKTAPKGQTSAAAAVEKAKTEAASETPEKPGDLVRTSEGALAWAQQWAAYYCSIPKNEEDGFIDETAASIRICKSINSQAEDIFSDAINYSPEVAAEKAAMKR